MVRKIKALGLALVAVSAMSAVLASGASAAEFTASSYPAHGSGGQSTANVFTIQGQKVECKEASFTATLSAPSSQLTITPFYNSCTAFGFIGAKIDMNGCDYLVTATFSHTGTMHIVCPAGKKITITAGGCTVHIGGQTPTSAGINFSGAIQFVPVVSNIHASATSSFPCTLSAGNTTAEYKGSFVVSSTEGKLLHVW